MRPMDNSPRHKALSNIMDMARGSMGERLKRGKKGPPGAAEATANLDSRSIIGDEREPADESDLMRRLHAASRGT